MFACCRVYIKEKQKFQNAFLLDVPVELAILSKQTMSFGPASTAFLKILGMLVFE